MITRALAGAATRGDQPHEGTDGDIPATLEIARPGPMQTARHGSTATGMTADALSMR